MQRTVRGSGGAADSTLLVRIQKILRAAQTSAARTVNTSHVISTWLIGREIVEDEQRGHARASYQDRTLKQLAERLTETFGAGYSAENLKKFRQFYLVYPDYLSREQIGYALRTQFEGGSAAIVSASPLQARAPIRFLAQWTRRNIGRVLRSLRELEWPIRPLAKR